MKTIGMILGTLAIAGVTASAQSDDGMMKMKIHAEAMAGGVVTARFGMMGAAVKGAPYSAEGVTETTQTLGDGTHINRTETYTIYRDGEGRIRRESGSEVWISDPVAGASYVLNTKDQTAHKMILSKDIAMHKMRMDEMHTAKLKAEHAGGPATIMFDGGQYSVDYMPKTTSEDKAESLGAQQMEGVGVTGTRMTTVIPQGQIGNDRPLQMVHERWESPDLHVTILSKHTDPMMGDRTERLTNVRRGEPDPALFQVPANYQLQSEK